MGHEEVYCVFDDCLALTGYHMVPALDYNKFGILRISKKRFIVRSVYLRLRYKTKSSFRIIYVHLPS